MLHPNMLEYFIKSVLLYLFLCFLMFGLIFIVTGESILNDWGLRIILVSSSFFYFIAFGMMRLLKVVLEDDDDRL